MLCGFPATQGMRAINERIFPFSGWSILTEFAKKPKFMENLGNLSIVQRENFSLTLVYICLLSYVIVLIISCFNMNICK